MTQNQSIVVLSSGEPAGIGPDICCALALDAFPVRLAVLGDAAVLGKRAQMLGLGIEIVPRANPSAIRSHVPGQLQVLPVPMAVPVVPGRLDVRNAASVLEMLSLAAEICMNDSRAALVTAPVQKSIITESGVAFSGHTEFLAQRTQAPRAVMLLAGPKLRVALATTHLPLREVAGTIRPALLEETLRIIDGDLKARFGIARPRILVLGLNPHAGESGTLGREEIETIQPVIERLQQQGLELAGPAPADTAFTPESLAGVDVVLAMYHDQGLPVIKAQGFGEVVNVTLGLPIVRTSVDHGTALDLAGTGRARHDSLHAAVQMAISLAHRSSS